MILIEDATNHLRVGFNQFQGRVSALTFEWDIGALAQPEAARNLPELYASVDSAIKLYHSLDELDTANRGYLYRSEVSEDHFQKIDDLVLYISRVWLAGCKQLLKMLSSAEDFAKATNLRNFVAEMEANLRFSEEAELVMGDSLVLKQDSAIAEYRSGQTEPFFQD